MNSFLCRLVGSAMTPALISQAIPKLHLMTTEHVNQMIQSNTTTVGEEISHKYTLDVAGKIILELNQTKDEEIKFQQNLNTWLKGLLSFHVLFLPGLRFSKEWKARQNLVDIIERKITIRIEIERS